MITKIGRAAVVGVLALGATLLAVTTAQARPGGQPGAALAPVPAPTLVTASPVPYPRSLTCGTPSYSNLDFAPPLTQNLQMTTITKTTKYVNCVSTLLPGPISGTSNSTFSMYDQCQMIMNSGTVQFTITWNTGQTSTITATRTPVIYGNTLTVTFTGTVTAGFMNGYNALQIFTGSAVDLNNCLAGTGTVRSLYSNLTLRLY